MLRTCVWFAVMCLFCSTILHQVIFVGIGKVHNKGISHYLILVIVIEGDVYLME